MNTSFKYLYLDDEEPDAVRIFITAIEKHEPCIKITLCKPRDFKEQMAMLKTAEFNGLILDLRLDQCAQKVGYRATSLAQEVRTRAAEGIREFRYPIALWSTEERIKPFDDKDNSGHDLFDLRSIKGDIAYKPEEANQVALRLKSLAQGYQEIAQLVNGKNQSLDWLRCLGFTKVEEAPFLDPRLIGLFDDRNGKLPPHEFAQVLLHNLLKRPGVLLDEDWVAVRLGIDRGKSPDFSQILKKHLEVARYGGVFAEGWPRFWSALFEEWWRRLKGCPGSLRSLPAEERVAFLKKALKLSQLTAATPHRVEDSSAFWTQCRLTKQPLDPRDGFLVECATNDPWQEKLYISAFAAFTQPNALKTVRLSPLEIERFKREHRLRLDSEVN